MTSQSNSPVSRIETGESWLLETEGEDIARESWQKHLEEGEVGQLLSLQLNPPYEHAPWKGMSWEN